MARWHHIGSLLFGTLVIVWVFNGMMSMEPWGLFKSPNKLNVSVYRSAAFDAAIDA